MSKEVLPRLDSLPVDILNLVLQQPVLTLQDVLNCCIAHPGRLQKAVIASVQELELGLKSPPADVQGSWLSKYGRNATTVSVCGSQWILKQLPFEQLLKLDLLDCDVQLGPAADGTPGVIAGCPKLTHLELKCNIMDAPAGAVLRSLSDLQHLQHLKVVPKTGDALGVPYALAGLSPATLPRLQHLTYLQCSGLSAVNLLQLGDLTKLQELYLVAAGGAVVGPSTAPGLQLPPSLQKLVLASPVESGLLSLVPATLQHLHCAGDVQDPAEWPGSWLSCMSRLQHLTVLSLKPRHGLQWPPVGPAYAALTASSSLVCLELCHTNCPQGIWQHVFSAGRELQQLTSFSLFEAGAALTGAAWGAGDLASLVSCCPNLRSIAGMPLQPGRHVSELHKLTALTHLGCELVLQHGQGGIGVSMSGLAAVTRLQELQLTLGNRACPATALLLLTSLSALTHFRCSLADDEDDDVSIRHLQLETLAGQTPDVWLQLLEHCAADPVCQPTVMRSLAQHVAELRASGVQEQQTASQQAQLSAAQKQQAAGLQKQSAAQQQLFAGLQVQLTAQEQQFAGLRQQLTKAQELTATLQKQSAAQEQIDSLQAQSAAQQQQTASLQAQLMEEQLAAKIQRTAGLQAQLTEQEQRTAGLQVQLSAVQEQATSLQEQSAAQKQLIADLQVQLTAQEQHSAGLQVQLTKAQQQTASLQEQSAAQQQQSASLQNQSAAQQQLIASLQVQFTGQQQQTASLQEQSTAQQQLIASLQQQTASLQAQFTEQQRQTANLQEQSAAQQQLLAVLYAQVTKAQEQTATLQKQSAAQQQQQHQQAVVLQEQSAAQQQLIASLQAQLTAQNDGWQGQLQKMQADEQQRQTVLNAQLRSMQQQLRNQQQQMAELQQQASTQQQVSAQQVDSLQGQLQAAVQQQSVLTTQLQQQLSEQQLQVATLQQDKAALQEQVSTQQQDMFAMQQQQVALLGLVQAQQKELSQLVVMVAGLEMRMDNMQQ